MQGTIVVIEKRARWLPELQRQFTGCLERVVLGTPGADPRQLASESDIRAGKLVVVFDLPMMNSTILQHLRTTRNRSLATIAICPPEVAVFEPTLRELGLTSFHVLPLDGLTLADECRRLLRTSRPASQH